MTMYTVSIDFFVDAKYEFQVERFSEVIQDIVSAQMSDHCPFLSLVESELTGIYKDGESEGETFDQYAAWDEQSARERREINNA